MRKLSTLAVITLISILSLGCQRLMNQDAAIQKAIRDHLAERSDLAMDKMVLEMKQVRVDGDKASAEVVFRTTSDPPSQMAYHYELHRSNGTWLVDNGRPSASGTQHPQMGEEESSSPSQPHSGELPAGHPPIGGTPGQGSPDQTNPHGDMPPPSAATK